MNPGIVGFIVGGLEAPRLMIVDRMPFGGTVKIYGQSLILGMI